MPRCIRASVPGGTFFFTVALLERRRRLLTEYIGELRAAFTAVRLQKPFTMNAIVVLLDHLHCIWTNLNNATGGMRCAFPPYELSRNSSDSSPSFVSVDSNSRVEGGRRRA